MSLVAEALIAALGESAVITGETLEQRAVSYWDSSPTRAVALVRPRSTEEVSEVLRICYQYGQQLVVQGGLTGCVEGGVAGPKDVILSMERMSTIEDIDVVEATATVQAGAVLQVLQEAVAESGLLFPLDLGARGTCTIGGNVATNAGGINVLRYGMMRNLVLGLEVVLVDGTVLSSMNRMTKDNAGYDLKQLFIGSEGTLGVVTRVVLKLFPQSLSCHTALVTTDEFEKIPALLRILQRDLAGSLSAYEVMLGRYYRAVTEEGWHRSPMDRNHAFYVIIEAEGGDQVGDGVRFNSLLEKVFEEGVITDAVIPKSTAERRAIWSIREDFDAILHNGTTYLYDISLPIRDMARYLEQVQNGIKRRWEHSECYVLGHLADGNLHLFVKPGEPGDFHYESDCEVYEPLRQFGGSISAEHGVGLGKKAWLTYSRSLVEVELMRALKNTLDPGNLLNAGRIF